MKSEKDDVLPCSSSQSGCVGSAARQHAGGSPQSPCNWLGKAPCCAWSSQTSASKKTPQVSRITFRYIHWQLRKGRFSLQLILLIVFAMTPHGKPPSTFSVPSKNKVAAWLPLCFLCVLCSLLYMFGGWEKVCLIRADTFYSRPLPPSLHRS